jgi:hypothetical protein
MKKLIAAIMASLGLGANAGEFELNYDQMVTLDAEELAETGIKEAYEKLKPILKKYVQNPVEVAETIDPNLPGYSVYCLGVKYEIYSPASSDSEAESWGKATYAFFSIVNAQLKESDIKFYAINGGNDLGGMFLTQQQVTHAKVSLKKTDWPYLPTTESPWYGQYH